MKKGTKIFLRLLCVAFCVVLAVSTAPVSRAAGMMRFIIDDKVYNKVYNDMGSLVLTHWNYDASEDKLTLQNFGTSDSPETPIFIYPYSGNITVEIQGDNYIQASREMAMIIIGHVTFTGSGTLNIIAADTYGIYTDYSVTISDSANLNINALAGITALKGFDIHTAGTVNIHTTGKCLYAYEDISVTQGTINFSGSNGFYTAYGDVFISGGDTDVLINSTSRAIYAPGEDSYIEWSANAALFAGESSPGTAVTSYNGEKYLRMSFTGIPKLNPPREIYWDDTVIDSAGATNPVGRWSAVENASGYLVSLYYYNEVGYTLTKTFTVTDALSCNFGGYFTTYGKYFFSVQALGDEVNYASSNNSSKTTGYYYFTGEVESRFYVTLPESDYFTVVPESGSTVVYYGESYSFTVEVDPAYTQSEVLVWANGVRVALRHGKYTVDNVTENLVIKIGDMLVNTYTVNLPEHEAFTIYPLPDYSTEVEYGGSFAFSVELSDIYLDSDIVVSANGTELSAKYGIIYTISNITEDQTVEISGLVRDNYQVVYQHLDGTYITEQTVDHGSTASAPDNPTLTDGLSFAGWSLKDGTIFDFSTPIEGQTVLYARFEPEKENGYYLISTLDQFTWFRDEVNFGNTAINAKLCADIAMNEGNYILMSGIPTFTENAVIWEPIGGYDYSDNEDYVKFYEGNFDGCGYTISGLYISYDKMSPEASDLGVFGIISETASITNLNVTLSNFEAYGNMGSIVGINYGTVSNCASSAVIEGVEDIGGIVGENHGDVTDCSFNGTVKAEEYSSNSDVSAIGGYNVGGIVGNIADTKATVSGCTNNGAVTAKKNAGGIVGAATAETCAVSNCVNTATVYAEKNAAGILAYNPKITVTKTEEITDEESSDEETTVTVIYTTTVENCVNYGEVSSLESSGGIVADAGAVVKSCTNNGVITSTADAGGIVSNANATIENCENVGKIEGTLYSGGFAALGDVTIRNSVNTGEIVSSEGTAAGFMAEGSLDIMYCYNLGTVTGVTCAGGIAADLDGAAIVSCHNYAVVSAESTDGIVAQLADGSVERSYSVSELTATSTGIAATKELFCCGYVAIFLNGDDESPVWAQGAEYPVFADEENEPYVFPLDGDGSKLSPYVISTENELRTVSAYINNHSGWSALHYKLDDDIAISNPETANNFIPFGSVSNQFTGSFDGDGYTISGLNLSLEDNNVALFRIVAASGQIKNLNVSGFTVNGKKNTAALVGTNRGEVYNCSVTDSEISGTENTGAVIGYNFGTVSYVTNAADVQGTMSVGGIVGLHEAGSVLYSINYGTVHGVDGTESSVIGGIAGESYSAINYCGNMGSVSADEYAGGIIGIAFADFRSLYNHGAVSAESYSDCIVGYYDYESEEMPELCFCLEGTSSGQTGIGVSVPEVDFNSGMLAYALNNNGTEKNWAQGDAHPVGAAADGSDAVIYTVTYLSFGEVYYTSATKQNGAAVIPPEPVFADYNFLYWDTAFDNVTEDLVTTAVFDRSYYITYMPYATLDYFESDIVSVICGISPQEGMTVEQLRSQISNDHITIMDKDMIEYCDPDEIVYTGMTVTLYGSNEGEYYHVANVVVFGDISGDGKIDDTDAFLLNMIISEMIYLDEMYPAEQLAADVNRDGVVDEADAEFLQSYLLYDSEILQSANTDEI